MPRLQKCCSQEGNLHQYNVSVQSSEVSISHVKWQVTYSNKWDLLSLEGLEEPLGTGPRFTTELTHKYRITVIIVLYITQTQCY